VYVKKIEREQGKSVCPLLSYTERTCRTYHELGTSGWTARATSRWSMHFW
jgi:hypothetical protein